MRLASILLVAGGARAHDLRHALRPAGPRAFEGEVQGLAVRLDADGLRVIDPRTGAGGPVVRTRGWGRAGRPVEARLGDPVAGECAPERGADGRCVRRVERAGGDLTEWWIGLGHGLEQGWTVRRPPAGPGALVVAVSLGDVRDIGLRGDRLAFVDRGGRSWEVRDARSTDATGRSLPTRLRPAEGGLEVVVDDDRAVYPLAIDPVYQPAPWTVDGVAGGTPYLTRVASAGDVNGDGFGDVVGGNDQFGDGGQVYVFLGSAAGLSDEAATTLTGAPGEAIGSAVAGVGDVDGDGLDDVLVGAVGHLAVTGAAYLHRGTATGIDPVPTSTLVGEAPGDRFGDAVAAAGDVNADGFPDVVVGSYARDSERGRAYVFLGTGAGLDPVPATVIDGESTSSYLGFAVSGAGDVDADGHDDVVLGAFNWNGGTGRAYVHRGTVAGVDSTPAVTITGSANAVLGYAVAGAGDLDADGIDDLVIGLEGYSSRTGRVQIHLGSPTGPAATADQVLTGPAASGIFGSRLDGAGDVDGDGHADLLVGAPWLDAFAGRAFVFRGAPGGVDPVAARTWTGAAPGEDFGDALAGVGDLDGDGFDDVVVAAGAASRPEQAFVYPGSAGGPAAAPTVTIRSNRFDDVLGGSVAFAGDLDGDGLDDVVVGAEGHDDIGRAYVYLAGPAGLPVEPSVTLDGESRGERFGAVVASAGDVDGDGFDDLLVGAPWASLETGRVDLYAGAPGGPSATPTGTFTGETDDDEFGVALAGAGDVDGDGFADVIVGAPRADPWATGRAYLYAGSAAGPSPLPMVALLGEEEVDFFGVAVAGAGDVDGDGLGDVIVGAERHAASTGRAYVFVGDPGGVSPVPHAVLDGEGPGDEFGARVAGVGDLDGDGYDDVAVGAPVLGGDTGRAYVHPGSAVGTSVVAGTVLSGVSLGERFGDALAGAGDLDRDGYEDLLVGAPGWDDDSGRVAVHLGAPAGVGLASDLDLVGEAADDLLGGALAGGGDVDGDGLFELLAGAPGHGFGGGRAVVYEGTARDDDGDGYPPDVDCDDGDATLGLPPTWYADADGDGFGDASAPSVGCVPPPGTVADDTDCDDAASSVWPGAPEIEDDGVDQDCDGDDLPSGGTTPTTPTAGDPADEKPADEGCGGCVTGGAPSGPLLLVLVALVGRRGRGYGAFDVPGVPAKP